MIELSTGVLIGGIGTVIGITGLALKMVDRGEGKRSKIYKYIERERKDAEQKYVPTLLCDERSGNLEKKLDEIGEDVKKILTKNGLK